MACSVAYKGITRLLVLPVIESGLIFVVVGGAKHLTLAIRNRTRIFLQPDFVPAWIPHVSFTLLRPEPARYSRPDPLSADLTVRAEYRTKSQAIAGHACR